MSWLLTSVVIFAELLFLWPGNVAGITCHCDFCSISSNNTCQTDGYCLSLTWLQAETRAVHHAYRCLDRRMYFPRQVPAQCSIPTRPHVAVVTACCNTDMCNLHLNPSLPPNTRSVVPPLDEEDFSSLVRRRHNNRTSTARTPTSRRTTVTT